MTVDGSGDAPTIQAGIDSAAVGDTVLVHDGTYTGPGNKELEFHGKNIVLKSASGPASTVIDCEETGRGIWLHGGEGYEAMVEGFTIRNGVAGNGGGIRVDDQATIRECWILDNTAYNSGGGIIVWSEEVRIDECLIVGNSCPQVGGGICGLSPSVIYVRRSVVSSNTGRFGGGIGCYGDPGYYLRVDSCLVAGNLSTLHAGGLYAGYASETGHVDVYNSTVAGNRASEMGGGIWLHEGIAMFQRSIIWGNCALWGAQGVVEAPWADFLWCDVDASEVLGNAIFWECIDTDPLFCEPMDCSGAPRAEGDYSLDAASPCLPAQTGGYLIGAYGQGCDIYTSVALGDVISQPGLAISPNPSGGALTIRYGRAATGPSTIQVFDIAGRLVRVLAAPGREGNALWDGKDASGRDVGPGVYFVRVSDRAFTDTKRVILVR
ncbi:MAG: T9SS type A sorting domain-containing protein [Candidatus Eisenbacteria bacterium]